jgi:hypothetical protein
MGSATTTIVSNADVDYYFTSVNASYLRALKGNNRAIYPSIAYVPPAAAMRSEKVGVELPDGTMGNGTRVKFPINLAASAIEVWPYGQPRKVEPFSTLEVSVDLLRWAPPAKREFYDVFSSDIFGLIQSQIPDMMDRAQIVWDVALSRKLVENEAWQGDGISFFTPAGAPHQANPFKPGVGLFYNDVPITGIDGPEMRRLLGILENMPGPDGLPLDTDNVEIMVLAPTSDMELQLLQVFQAAIAAQTVGTAAASVSNMLVGRAKVILFKQLARTPKVPIFGGKAQDRTQVGYMLAVPKGEGRPVAVVPNRHPTAYYTGLNGSDHLRASSGAVEFGWDAFGAAKLVVPQRALRFIVKPV